LRSWHNEFGEGGSVLWSLCRREEAEWAPLLQLLLHGVRGGLLQSDALLGGRAAELFAARMFSSEC